MHLSDIILPFLRQIDPETAHKLSIMAIKCGFAPKLYSDDDSFLKISLWGIDFPNPVGLAAGFDKNVEITKPMLNAGFGFVEAGSITPKPQLGNPKPRIFRLAADRAIINRLGFNNKGMDFAAENLKHRPKGIIGINIGKNKSSDNAEQDYAIVAKALSPMADYIVINVSSPNTPNLRALQGAKELSRLIITTKAAMKAACNGKIPPLLIKISPDLMQQDMRNIIDVSLENNIQGLVVTNTTITRPKNLSECQLAHQTGGLSGEPLFELATEALRQTYKLSNGKLPLIGVGGISNGQDAYIKIKAGASLIQLYSALIYQGFGLVKKIKHDLVELAKADGFRSIKDAIGADHK